MLVLKWVTSYTPHLFLQTKDRPRLTAFSTIETILSLMDARYLHPLLNKAQTLVRKRTCAHWLCVWMFEWLVWTFRLVLLLHPDRNVNLYVNVIQQTGYRHQSYLSQVEYSEIMATMLLCRLGNINIHLCCFHYIMRIIVNLGISFRHHNHNDSEWMAAW